MITDGMPLLWIMFNPSDLQFPIIFWLAGVSLLMSDSATSTFKTATAIMNLVAKATFFDETYKAIFDHLFITGSRKSRLFGPVSTYFGTVETNGRGILHLHCLIWLKGMTNLSNFRQRMRDDPDYLSQLIQFLDHIIKASLSVPPSDTSATQNPCPSEFTSFFTTHDVDVFRTTLIADSNKVASKVQMHSISHNASCYKFGKSGSKCRFNFPGPLVKETYVNKCNCLHFKQNNM